MQHSSQLCIERFFILQTIIDDSSIRLLPYIQGQRKDAAASHQEGVPLPDGDVAHPASAVLRLRRPHPRRDRARIQVHDAEAAEARCEPHIFRTTVEANIDAVNGKTIRTPTQQPCGLAHSSSQRPIRSWLCNNARNASRLKLVLIPQRVFA